MHGTIVYLRGYEVMQSRNLRAMRDYARVSPVARVETRPNSANPFNGVLSVTYANGAGCVAHFADYSVLLEWVGNRRTWRNAEWHVSPPLPKHTHWKTREHWQRLQKLGITKEGLPE